MNIKPKSSHRRASPPASHQASLEFEEFRKLAAIDMQKLKHENRAGRKFIRDTF